MAVKGVFASDQNIDGTRQGDFASMILRIYPEGSAPLLALTSGMESEGATDISVNWFEESKISGQHSVTAGVNASGTNITVTDASDLVPMTVLMNLNTGEVMFITAIAGNVLTVIRGYGGTTAAAITTTQTLQKIATAFEEGANRPQAVANLGVPKFNYTQIFATVWDVTGTAKAIQHRTGNIKAKNQQDAIFYHSEELEKSMVWGVRAIGIENNRPFRTMNGINSMITTNVMAAGATTDYEEIDEFLKDVFSKNVKGKPNERIAFTGNDGLQVINNVARKETNSRINLEPGETEFGLKIMKWISPYGTIMLKTHPLMVENPVWTKDLYVYHPGCIKLRYLRRTFMEDYDKEGLRAGRDADYGVIRTEMSVQYMAEITGGKLTGLTAAA